MTVGDGWEQMGAIPRYRRVDFLGVKLDMSSEPNRPVVVLREAGGDRCLVVSVDGVAAAAIAYTDRGEEDAERLPHMLMIDVLTTFDLRLEQVVLDGVTDDPDRAVLTINGREIMARPADGITLALRTGVPLYVSEQALVASGLVLTTEDSGATGS